MKVQQNPKTHGSLSLSLTHSHKHRNSNFLRIRFRILNQGQFFLFFLGIRNPILRLTVSSLSWTILFSSFQGFESNQILILTLKRKRKHVFSSFLFYLLVLLLFFGFYGQYNCGFGAGSYFVIGSS